MRRRITAIAASIVAIVLVLVAVIVVLAVRRQLLENLDRSLDQRAAEVEAMLDADETQLVTSSREDHFAQVLDQDGSVLVSTPNAEDISFADRLPDDRSTVFTATDVPIEDDAYRVVIRRTDDGHGAAYVVVGENIDDLRDTTRALVVTLVIVIPVAVLTLAAAVWWLVGRTLRPVEAIRQEVDEIGVRDLERRVPVPGTGDEVDRLAETMNRMLARLDRSVEDQRRFVADASHELRTPLTRMRTSIEVALLQSDTDHRATLESTLDDTVEMQRLVEDLLFLAHRDAGAPVSVEPIDVDVIVADEVRSARSECDVDIDATGVSAAVVAGRAAHLGRLVRNLLSNACRHANERVEVSLTEADEIVTLVVADDGPGVSEQQRERIFERFVRLDEARHTDSGGAGLGLAIAREIARDHGGDIDVGERVGGGARFVVTLPVG